MPSRLLTVLLIVLILVLVGAFPVWPHAAAWGWYPAGGLGFLLLLVIILIIAGVL